jgi:ribonuclease MRP protein subunit RMP1
MAAPVPQNKTSRVTDLQSALSSVRQSLQLLHSFFHRNKNQHRRSAWWTDLCTLRRSSSKLLLAGEAYEKALVQAESRKDQTRQHSKRGRATGTMDDVPAGSRSARLAVAEREFHQRAQWLRGEVVPRAYMGFTQLAADNQFAAMGILLLGVLAHIAVSLATFGVAPPEQEKEGQMPSVSEPAGPKQNTIATGPEPALANPALGGQSDGDDLGVTITRDTVEHTRSSLMRSAGEKRALANQDHEVAINSLPKARKKKRRTGGDEFDDLFSELV